VMAGSRDGSAFPFSGGKPPSGLRRCRKIYGAESEHIRRIVVFALNTGMRRQEILTLNGPQVRSGFIYLQKT